jgi:protein TonB
MIGQKAAAQAIPSTAQSPRPDAPTVYKPGTGVELPRVTKMVRPKYTAEALARRIQGVVWVDAVVLPNGKVGNVSVTKSLDRVYGLDQEAVNAAKKWRFVPGKRFGTPVAVLVTIELTFTLKAERQPKD